MITHIALFRWKPGITDADIQEICDGLATLSGLVPTIETYRFGRDLGISSPANMDFGVVSTFADEDDWRLYDEHPDHERVRAELIRPWVAERAALQLQS